ncbi:MAG: hypothetical protein HKO63_05275 [Acidimicrobiia bacterium]|nr:hypothetical protein [Acidimicrobiia bacterium]NNL12985.1 hypothetical protein [Acidimicrobiia bacterium]NNL97597.1 hypothetical protein [Acidimicrobiia bacterium]
MLRLVVFGLALMVVAACGGSKEARAVESLPETPLMCADVEDVVITAEEGRMFRFDVTVRSADTGWDKYADAWEVRAPNGSVLGTRTLAHPHVDEQPFTRSLTGVEIPADITQVEVAARDLVDGFCGTVVGVVVPRP